MTVVVDVSVAIKWVLEEAGTDAAARLQLEQSVAAPDFMLLECANVLWKKARRGDIRREQAEVALAAIRATPLQLFATSDYATAAQALAFELEQTVYDSLYLAVALAERMIMVTADRRFAEGVARHGVYSHAVSVLES